MTTLLLSECAECMYHCATPVERDVLAAVVNLGPLNVKDGTPAREDYCDVDVARYNSAYIALLQEREELHG